MPIIWVKGHLVQNLLSADTDTQHTHTHTHLIQCCTWTTN